MFESLILAIKVVFPLIVYMGLGILIRRRKWMSQTSIKEMNTVVFKVLLSTMIFLNIYQSDLEQDFQLNLLIYAIVSLIVMYLILNLLIPKVIKDRTIAPVMIQGIYRSNFVLFGLQITASICGSENLGMATVLIAIIIPMFNALAVLLFERYQQEQVNVMKLLKGIATNPLIIASVLGIISVFIKPQFPPVMESALKSISQMATPLSLILLGGTITVSGIKKYWKYTLSCAIGRLIVVPVVFLSIAVILGFRGNGLVALMVMLASPTAVSSFTMASQMGGNEELAGQIVAVTTIFSVVTIFLWTYFLHYFCLI